MTMRERIARAFALCWTGDDNAIQTAGPAKTQGRPVWMCYLEHADIALAAMDDGRENPLYHIQDSVPEYNAIVILWPKELPIPRFVGEPPNRTMPKTHNS